MFPYHVISLPYTTNNILNKFLKILFKMTIPTNYNRGTILFNIVADKNNLLNQYN